MITKTIKYNDFKGVEREEEFMFNMTQSELLSLELKTEGRLTERLQRLMKSPHIPSLMQFFEQIIEVSYGEISEDGRRFVKSDEIYNGFRFTPAYDKLMTELLSNDEAAAAFIRGILPQEVVEEMDKADHEKAKAALNVIGGGDADASTVNT